MFLFLLFQKNIFKRKKKVFKIDTEKQYQMTPYEPCNDRFQASMKTQYICHHKLKVDGIKRR